MRSVLFNKMFLFRTHITLCTCLTGSYMFMQHSVGQTSGKSARLVSPLLTPTQANCLSFYFFFIRKMVSSDFSLTIFTRHGQTFVETPVWEITSKDLKAMGYWNRAVLPLKKKHNFQVSSSRTS